MMDDQVVDCDMDEQTRRSGGKRRKIGGLQVDCGFFLFLSFSILD